MSRTFPDRPDSYKGFLTPDDPVKVTVARMIPPQPGGEIEIGLLDYPVGRGFGAISYEEPVQLIHPLGDDQELIEEIPWTRLDAADMDNLDVWQDSGSPECPKTPWTISGYLSEQDTRCCTKPAFQM